MSKLSLCRHPEENFLLPYYLLDFNFVSPQDYLADIQPLPSVYPEEEAELFTSLNISLQKIRATNITSFRIPVYGVQEQADYFFTEGFFQQFLENLTGLLKTVPQAQIILEYQINCLSLEALPRFLEKAVQLRSLFPQTSSFELEFHSRSTPSYLSLTLIRETWKEQMEKSLSQMQTGNNFPAKEITHLKDFIKRNEDSFIKEVFGPNAMKQLLSTFYYSILKREAGKKTLTVFPGTLPLLQRSAKAFLEINPIKNSATSETNVSNYQELLNQKIHFFKTTNFSSMNETEKNSFLARFLEVKDFIRCEHTDLDMLEVVCNILELPQQVPGVIVEAGVFKGGGTARLSMACKSSKRKLFAFDSFQGLPLHEESSPQALYPPGVYFGSKKEVQNNLEMFGESDAVTLVEGWFEKTLPGFNQPVAIAYLDVDLASSTEVCLRYLWPLLIKNGVIYSHDGHLKEVSQLIKNPEFWKKEFGESLPKISTVFGVDSFLKIEKTL